MSTKEDRNQTIKGGATLWARQTIDSAIFRKKGNWFKVWFYIVSRVNHKGTKQFKRGEGHFRYWQIMDECNVKKDQLKHIIKFLKVGQMIATQKATRGFIIKVLNYNKYQSLVNYHATLLASRSATHPPQKCHTINKNDKYVNNNTPPIVPPKGDNKDNKKINQIFKIFYDSGNVTINYANKRYRNDALALINKIGLKKTIRATKYAMSIQGEKYSPLITNPTQLKNKLFELMTFYKKQNASTHKIYV